MSPVEMLSPIETPEIHPETIQFSVEFPERSLNLLFLRELKAIADTFPDEADAHDTIPALLAKIDELLAEIQIIQAGESLDSTRMQSSINQKIAKSLTTDAQEVAATEHTLNWVRDNLTEIAHQPAATIEEVKFIVRSAIEKDTPLHNAEYLIGATIRPKLRDTFGSRAKENPLLLGDMQTCVTEEVTNMLRYGNDTRLDFSFDPEGTVEITAGDIAQNLLLILRKIIDVPQRGVRTAHHYGGAGSSMIRAIVPRIVFRAPLQPFPDARGTILMDFRSSVNPEQNQNPPEPGLQEIEVILVDIDGQEVRATGKREHNFAELNDIMGLVR